MRMSLKEFFLSEANFRSSTKKSSVGRKSSTNVQINVEEAIGDPGDQSGRSKGPDRPPVPRPQEEALGDPGSQSARSKGRDKPPSPRPVEEAALTEYEDPTSSKRDSDDDSQWSGPMSSKERMPHQQPHDLAQQRGVDGWDEMHKSSNRHYPEHGKDLEDFFGGEPYPKGSHGAHSKKGSHEVDEAGPRELPDKLPASWMDQPMSSARPPSKGGEITRSSSKGSGMAVPWRAQQRASQAAAEPPTVRKPGEETGMGDPDFLSKMGLAPDEPKKSSGGPKMRDVIKTKSGSAGQGYSADDEGPEGDVSQYYDYGPERRSRSISPKLKEPTDDEEGQIMAGEPLGAETAEPEEMSWDELRATNPEAAEDLEREVPDADFAAAKFTKREDGRLYMDAPAGGGRRAYLGADLGWTEMDDGDSPAGEF